MLKDVFVDNIQFFSAHTIVSTIKIQETGFFFSRYLFLTSPSNYTQLHLCLFSMAMAMPKLFDLTAEGFRLMKAHRWRCILLRNCSIHLFQRNENSMDNIPIIFKSLNFIIMMFMVRKPNMTGKKPKIDSKLNQNLNKNVATTSTLLEKN